MLIDCETCRLRQTDACRDCVVTFLLDRSPAGRVDIPPDDVPTLRALQDGGLVPPLLHTPAGAAGDARGDLRAWSGAPGPLRR